MLEPILAAASLALQLGPALSPRPPLPLVPRAVAPTATATGGPAGSGSAAAFSLLTADAVVDTILDIGVYTLLAGVVGITLYSIFVTLDESNKTQGGWQKRDDAEVPEQPQRYGEVPADVESRLRSGAVYDPVTDEWTMPKEPAASKAAAAGGGGGAEVNRYERRARKKAKAQMKKKKR
mmetsp:Transcript_4103/g.12916  ORF Transcript_4103/g.12916 Transcript_4103/m.12916 type:complete len:179 (-) Transcript_4103:260-796(-)